jgi:hypothetical protein
MKEHKHGIIYIEITEGLCEFGPNGDIAIGVNILKSSSLDVPDSFDGISTIVRKYNKGFVSSDFIRSNEYFF